MLLQSEVSTYTQSELHRVLTLHGSGAHDHSKLSREEALELCRRCSDGGDRQARNYLVRALKQYAIVIAPRYCQYGFPLSELIARGELGIVHALTEFDFERGSRFSTFVAYWIRMYVLNHVIHSLRSFGVEPGMSRSKVLFKLCRDKVRIANLLGEGGATTYLA